MFWLSRLRRVNRTDNDELAGLFLRISGADPVAFADLHARLRPRLSARLAAVPLDPIDVIAVADATFVEVWRFAGRWPGREAGALGWVYAIAARRAADRRATRAAAPAVDAEQVDVCAPLDRQMGIELDALLAQPPNHRS